MKLLNLFNWVQSLVSFFTLNVGGGGSGGGGTTQSTSYSTNLPEYAQPYYQELMKQTGKAVYTTDSAGNVTGVNQLPAYTGERVAGFNPDQTSTQAKVMGMTAPTGFANAAAGLTADQIMSGNAANVGLSKALNYNPNTVTAGTISSPSLAQYQMAGPSTVNAPTLQQYQMTGAANINAPTLQQYAMKAAAPVGVERATSQYFNPAAAAYYGDPYQQGVTNIALREAELQGAKDRQAGMLGSIGRGTFGGARQALMQAEQNRGLNQNLADIQAKGSQAGYQNAQQQFLADQANRMASQQLNVQSGLQASLANQQAQQQANVQNLASQLQTQGLSADAAMKAALANQQTQMTTQQQNLAAKLQTQGLSADEAMKAALANQQGQMTTQQQNLAAQLQTQGLSADQAMKAALANQQTNLTAQQSNQQAQLQGAQLAGQTGIAGLTAGIDAAKAQAATAAASQTAELERLKAQAATGAEKQALQQKIDDLKYQTFQEQQNYQKQQLEYLSNILRGNASALGSSQVQYTPTPSTISQIGGLGLAGLGLAKALG